MHSMRGDSEPKEPPVTRTSCESAGLEPSSYVLLRAKDRLQLKRESRDASRPRCRPDYHRVGNGPQHAPAACPARTLAVGADSPATPGAIEVEPTESANTGRRLYCLESQRAVSDTRTPSTGPSTA